MRNVKNHFSATQGILATHSRDWNASRVNFQASLYFLFYNAPAIMTLQLLVCFTRMAIWQVANRESLARSSCENPLNAHTFKFITLSHTQLLHYFHLDTGYLIAKL